MRWMPTLMAVVTGAVVAVGATGGTAPARAAGTLRAGAAAVKITPQLFRPVYIAGYENNRVADSVRDDLWARVLVLDDGATRTAIVSCDLIGLSNRRVRQIRQRITSVPSGNVLISCTHVHSGPDTLGLWGKNSFTTGIDPIYMDRLETRIATAVESAAADLKPVRLSAATVTVPDGFVHNSREPIQDKELTALRFITGDGQPVANVIHYGSHPEVNKTKALTSDFIHTVRERVEAQYGGVAIYLNGALGGMVTPHIRAHTMEEMERVGDGVGRAALQALGRAEPINRTAILLKRADVSLPLENDGFKMLMAGKILDGDAPGGKIPTEVWRLDVGTVSMVTIPGEILPRPALDLKNRMSGKFRMVIALGNDELGYILDPDDFVRDTYKYERSMSVGRQTWPILSASASELLK